MEQANARRHLERMAALAREIEGKSAGALDALSSELEEVETAMGALERDESEIFEDSKLVETERLEMETELDAIRKAEVDLERHLASDEPDHVTIARDVRAMALVSLRHLRFLERRLDFVKEQDRRRAEDPNFKGPERRDEEDRRAKGRD